MQIQSVTADDLFEMGSDSNYELVRGELVYVPMAGFAASAFTANLAMEIGRHVSRHHLGNVTGPDGGYILERNPDTVLAPDIAFVRADRLPPRETWDRYLELAPDLVIEVVAPEILYALIMLRLAIYLRSGVPLIWIVDLENQSIGLFSRTSPYTLLSAGDVLNGGDVIPGFTCSITDLFS